MDCAVPNAASNLVCNKLTAIVTYKTRYINPEGENMTISFGFGESISVNAIIGLPTIKKWTIVLDIDAGLATSKLLRKYLISHVSTHLVASLLV